MIFIYTVFANKKEAEKISQCLVDKKLAVCVNSWLVASVFRWQGKTQKAKEYAALVKTTKKNFKAVEQFIARHHSYDAPCVIEIAADRLNKKYQKYVWETIGE